MQHAVVLQRLGHSITKFERVSGAVATTKAARAGGSTEANAADRSEDEPRPHSSASGQQLSLDKTGNALGGAAAHPRKRAVAEVALARPSANSRAAQPADSGDSDEQGEGESDAFDGSDDDAEEEEGGFADIDFNAPIPLDTAPPPASLSSSSDKRARLAALVNAAPKYEDFFGPREQHGDIVDTDSEDDDDDALQGGEDDSDADSDDTDSDADENDEAMAGDDADDSGGDSGGDAEDSGGDESAALARARRRMEANDDDDDDAAVDDDDDASPRAGGVADASDDDDDDAAATSDRRRVSFREGASVSDADGDDDDDGDSTGGGGDSDDSSSRPRPKSRHAIENEALSLRIAALEGEAIGSKPWHMTGEVRAQDRPQNSLLDAVMDYEQTTASAPAVTVETTSGLEDIIRRRIADSVWDDRVPVSATDNIAVSASAAEKAAAEAVSTAKSEAGLGEIYAAEYARSAMGQAGPDLIAGAEEEARALMEKLFAKLDALSNFNFTPKPAVADMRVTPNVPAIALEDVLPMGVSAAAARAPSEVHKGGETDRAGGLLRSTGEMSAAQREGERRAKKSSRRKERAAKAAERAAAESRRPPSHAGADGGPSGSLGFRADAIAKIAKAHNVTMGGGVSGGKSGAGGKHQQPSSSGAPLAGSSAFFSHLQREAQAAVRAVAGPGAAGGGGAAAAAGATSAGAKRPRPAAASAAMKL